MQNVRELASYQVCDEDAIQVVVRSAFKTASGEWE